MYIVSFCNCLQYFNFIVCLHNNALIDVGYMISVKQTNNSSNENLPDCSIRII